MNILVTGGAGYIGSMTCKELVKKGHRVVVYDNLSNSKAEYARWGELVVGDINDQTLVLETLKKNRIEAAFHFAGSIEVGESKHKPLKYYRNNVGGALSLAEALLAADVKHVVFSSTCAIYGNSPKIPLNEDGPQNPVSVYGETKLIGEKIFREATATSGLCAVMLRYFNASGADPDGESGERHDPESHLIPLIIQSVYDKNFELKVFGNDYPTADGTCIRDYTHVTDLADAHVKALEWSAKTKAKFEAFNLGSGKGSSVMEVIQNVERFTGEKAKYAIHGRREGDPAVLVADITKARGVLGWNPRYGIEDVVRTACNWHRSLRG